jgi:hypothetical protein
MSVTDIQREVSAIIDAGSSESLRLEYKATPYETTEGGRKEFAKDVSAFANRDGGLLIVGVKDKGGKIESVIGVEIGQIDSVILWMESVIRSHVSPHILGLRIAHVEHKEHSLIAVDVPRGLDPPYEVAAAGSRFFVREERSVRTMSRDEIKYAATRQGELMGRIDSFADSRWASLTRDAPTTHSLAPGQGGSLFQLFPLFSQSFSYRFDVPTLISTVPHYHAFHGRDVASAKPTLDGLEYRFRGDDGEFGGFVKIYRNGIIEVADGYVTNPDGRPLPGLLLMTSIIETAQRTIETSSEITGAESFVLDFRIRTEPGQSIAFFRDPFGNRDAVDRSELIFDKLEISVGEDWKPSLTATVRPLLDQVWQAWGFTNCGYFNDQGEFKPPR